MRHSRAPIGLSTNILAASSYLSSSISSPTILDERSTGHASLWRSSIAPPDRSPPISKSTSSKSICFQASRTIEEVRGSTPSFPIQFDASFDASPYLILLRARCISATSLMPSFLTASSSRSTTFSPIEDPIMP